MSSQVVKTKLVVYGCDALGYALSDPLDKTDNFTIFYTPIKLCPDLSSFDVVFLNYGALNLERGVTSKSELLSRYKQLIKALDGTTTLCVLYYRLPTPHDLGKIYPGRLYEEDVMKRWDILAERDLAQRILFFRFGLKHESFRNAVATFRIRREEFRNFVDSYSATESYFDYRFDRKQIICEGGNMVVGFVSHPNFIVLPFNLSRNEQEYVKPAYRCLANAILSYKAKIYYELPEWLEEFNYPNEEGLKKEEVEILEALEKVKEKEKRYTEFKQILYVGDDPLVDVVINFFENGLGIKTEREENYEEDLWILKNDERIALVEVKGLNKNVSRPDINKTDDHRTANDQKPDFPALLIANTFMKGIKSLNDKDKPVASDIQQHASRNNVLVMRTLDLARILYLIESEIKTKDQFLDIICSENGWLEVALKDWKVRKK